MKIRCEIGGELVMKLVCRFWPVNGSIYVPFSCELIIVNYINSKRGIIYC